MLSSKNRRVENVTEGFGSSVTSNGVNKGQWIEATRRPVFNIQRYILQVPSIVVLLETILSQA